MWRRVFRAVGQLMLKPVSSEHAAAALGRAARSKGRFDATTEEVNRLSVQELIKGGDESLLETAAAAAYNGTDGKKDVGRARALWESRGATSVDAAYKFAMCVREGDAEHKPDARRAAALLRGMAEKQHAQATYSLGVLLSSPQSGIEVTADDETEALRHFVAAARLGVAPALRNAANMFASGRGCVKDEAKALSMYELAAQTGDAHAHFTLGSWLCAGKGRPNAAPDWDLGFVHHQEAAKAGLAKAHFNLGTHFFTGQGHKQDFDKAAASFKLAADAGIPEAMLNLANMLDQGLGIPQDKAAAADLRLRAEAKMAARPAAANET
ncbi:hypothetical protein M885DRAFT_610116 [Pelagophyceae sp. CCMP2097]|nr:hypothetical protein M885DRAFT_610116 [Pelagophyceae sp. CCMP2097]